MACITITDIPAETHEKLQMLASLRGVSPDIIAIELLKEALTAHDAELAHMMKLELRLFGSQEDEAEPEPEAITPDE